MGLKLDKNNTGVKPIEPGEYEVYPHVMAEETAKSSGNRIAQFNYLIRDDVEQKFQGQEIRFDNFVEIDTAFWRMNQASEAAGMDMEAEYENIYEWGRDFLNRAVRVKVGLRENPNNGRKYPEITEFMESEYPGVYEGKEEKGGKGNPLADKKEEAPVEISDDDLPF